MSVYCYRCGQRLAGGARRCPNCGSSIFYDESGLREDFIKRGTAETPVMDENAAQAYSDHKDYEGSFGSAAGDAGSGSGTDLNGNAYGSTYGSSYPPYGSGSYGSAPFGSAPFGSAARSAGAAPVQTKRDVVAKWAMTCGICGLIMTVFPLVGLPLSVAAIVMGIMGLKAEHRRGRAIAGLIMGISGFLINAAMLALAIYIVMHPELQDQLSYYLR